MEREGEGGKDNVKGSGETGRGKGGRDKWRKGKVELLRKGQRGE